jgi:hypothetical protein
MNGLDVSIIIAWLTWISYSVSHRGPWGLWTNRQRIWYKTTRKRTGVGLPIEYYGTIPLITIPLFVLSLWAYTRTFPSTPLYISSILLIIISTALEKIWSVLHFDRRDPVGAIIVAILMIIFYTASAFTVGFTERPSNEWQNWPLMIILIFMVVWFSYNAYVDFVWLHYKGLYMTRKEEKHNPNIK